MLPFPRSIPIFAGLSRFLCRSAIQPGLFHSTVTLFARFLGLSTSRPLLTLV